MPYKVWCKHDTAGFGAARGFQGPTLNASVKADDPWLLFYTQLFINSKKAAVYMLLKMAREGVAWQVMEMEMQRSKRLD